MDQFVLDVFKSEVEQQCAFAQMALEDMSNGSNDPGKGGAARFWYGTQAFLAACANISKMCWPDENRKRNRTDHEKEPEDDWKFRIERGQEIRTVLGLTDASPLKPRELRNLFEHFDERLDLWTRTSPNRILLMRSIGHPGAFQIDGMGPNDMMGYFDLTTNVVTFQDSMFDLGPMIQAVQELYSKLRSAPLW